MPRSTWFGLLVLILIIALLGQMPLGRGDPKDSKKLDAALAKAAPPHGKTAGLLKKLSQSITLEKGIEPNTPLHDGLALLSNSSGIPILLNSAAFKEENAEVEIDSCPVKLS